MKGKVELSNGGPWKIAHSECQFLQCFSHCVVVVLLWGGSATNGANPSSFYSEPVNELDLLHPAHPLWTEVPVGGAPVTPAGIFMSLH